MAAVASFGPGDNTQFMRGRPGPGALIGLAIGAAVVALLIWLPRALSGDYYEIGDPLVVMGIPIIVVSVAIGALIGVPPSHAAGEGSTTEAQRSSRTSRTFVALGAVTAAALAILFFLWGIGAV